MPARPLLSLAIHRTVIGRVGRLDLWSFRRRVDLPAALALATVFGGIWLIWRRKLSERAVLDGEIEIPRIDSFGVGWGGRRSAAVCLALFSTRLPHVADVLLVTGVLLISRRSATRDVLGLVDWHLLVLFGALFIVTAALAETPLARCVGCDRRLRDRSEGASGNATSHSFRKSYDRPCPNGHFVDDSAQRPAKRKPLCNGNIIHPCRESADRRELAQHHCR